ncbi:MAG: SWIM zinc finger family protein [Candidatus Promineifilaceae bacterium]
MTQTYVIKETDVQALASAKSFERGRGYFRDGSVSDMARRGNLITAFVQGNDYEPYRVQVTLADFGIAETSCTCPYEQGGICKHIVATLLTAIHQPETIT